MNTVTRQPVSDRPRSNPAEYLLVVDSPTGQLAPPKLFLLQMAGESGAGKSSLARLISATTGGVVLDMDVIKSTALDAGADWELAGRVSHEALRALTDSLLGQGFCVILDQPCRFERQLTEGAAIAARHDASSSPDASAGRTRADLVRLQGRSR